MEASEKIEQLAAALALRRLGKIVKYCTLKV
jgi:hypothetical protein